MNIKTDMWNVSLKGVTAGRSGRVPAPPGAAGPSIPRLQGPGIERAMSDALSIAQMSQSVIHRAISIAMRLKSIAAAAIATGGVDRSALAETMGEIRSALGASAPAAPPAALSLPAASGNAMKIPAIGSELGVLRDAAGGMAGGDPVPIEKIDLAIQKLDEKMNSYTRAEFAITERMRSAAGSGSGVTAGPDTLSSRIVAGIKTDPSAALMVQGNISAAGIDRLMR